MKHLIFTVYDEKADAYLPTFVMHSQPMARRTFADMVADEKTHAFGRHPEDYTLYEIGLFDDLAGAVEPYESKKCVCTGLEVRQNTPEWVRQEKIA